MKIFIKKNPERSKKQNSSLSYTKHYVESTWGRNMEACPTVAFHYFIDSQSLFSTCLSIIHPHVLLTYYIVWPRMYWTHTDIFVLEVIPLNNTTTVSIAFAWYRVLQVIQIWFKYTEGWAQVLCKSYAIFIKDLNICGFLCLQGGPGTNSPRILRDFYTYVYVFIF